MRLFGRLRWGQQRVRAGLGIVLEGMTYAMRWLIVDLENSENKTKHTEVFCNRRRRLLRYRGRIGLGAYEFKFFQRDRFGYVGSGSRERIAQIAWRRPKCGDPAARRSTDSTRASRRTGGRGGCYWQEMPRILTPPFWPGRVSEQRS